MSSSTLCQGLQSCLEPSPARKNETFHIDVTNEAPEWTSMAAQNYGYPSPTLSPKSLEMCTESLGSETGSSIGETVEDFCMPESYQLQPWRLRESAKKVFRSGSFPPPLTSISGSDGVQVSSHREDGRLVLKAVSIDSASSFGFQTERSNGRLRLSLYKSLDSEEFDLEADDEDEEGDFEEENDFVGYDNFTRLSTRCKEGGRNKNKGWETFWVAIS